MRTVGGTALVVIALVRCRAKVVSGTAQLDGVRTEHEMAKFSYPVGRGRVKCELTNMNGYPSRSALRIYAYVDTTWGTVQRAPTCEEKAALAAWSAPVRGRPRHLEQRVVEATDRTHVWFFMLQDCTLEQWYHEVPSVGFRVEMTGPELTQLPVEERGMGRIHVLNVLAALLLVVHLGRSMDAPHIAVVVLAATVALDGLASLCEWVHVAVFARNGVGSYACDALSALLEALCDAVIAFLLFSIGAGWTLRSNLSDDEKAGRSPLRDETLFETAASAVAPLASALRYPLALPRLWLGLFFMTHLALAQWSRVYSDDFDTFHDWEHLPGRILVALRCIMAALFVPVMLRSQACAGARLRAFYLRWAQVGTAWFVALPLLVVFASLSPRHRRHRIVAGGSTIVQTVALSLLALLFTGNFAHYFHAVSTVGQGDSNLDLGRPSPAGPGGAALGPDLAAAISKSQAKLPPNVRFGRFKVRLD